MKNFKEIAEKCLAGELSGTFILSNHTPLHSKYLYRYKIGRDTIPGYYWLGGLVNDKGEDVPHKKRIQNFIPDNMQEQIKIDIPEGMEVIQEETPDGIKIKFIKKSLSYKDIENKLSLHTKIQTQYFWNLNVNEGYFSKKVEVLRKLTNIRNYFGKPKHNTYGHALYYTIERSIHATPALYPSNDQRVIFDTKEHAEQAIKMLGDELKYLFEPW